MEPPGECGKIFSVLYVEDEPITRILLQNIISRKFPEVEIHTAENGKIGLEIFEKISADIVLTDIDLPMMNGLKMASEIRKIDPHAEIIILSGQRKAVHDADCTKIGISYYLEKPFLHEELIKAIEGSMVSKQRYA